MNGNCDIKNPLVRDGVSQKQRLLKALHTSYVKVDERDINDLLWFIRNYSKKVQYYNKDNEPDDDWKDFVENDVSTIISIISQKDLSEIKECFTAHFSFIKNAVNLDNQVKAVLNNIFKHLFFISDELNAWYKTSAAGLKLNTELKQTISSQLKGLLKELVAAYKFASTNSYLYDDITDKCYPFVYKDDFLVSKFNKIWIDTTSSTPVSWSSYLSSINEDGSLFSTSSTKIKQVKFAADKLKLYVDKFIGAQSRLIHNSPGYLKETLENWSSHEPNMALLLAFLQLFRYAQGSINKITKRHLDFYYKRVLRLKPNEAVPDTVHVIFELAKQVDSYLVKEATQLKAGRDSEGNEVVYKVDKDTVFNKGAVDKLKSVFVDKKDNYRVYSAPVANSKDGSGKKFDMDEPKWKTFGESQKTDTGYQSEDNRTMLFTDIGLAITSPIFFLYQGTRVITITFTTDNDLTDLVGREISIKEALTFSFSSEKKWVTADIDSVNINTSNKFLEFVIELGTEAEPTFAFNNSELEDNFDSKFPVLKVLLINETDSDYIYKTLKNVTISKIDISTEVTNLKDLILQNDSGLLKPGKPFYPFTTIPGKGSSFYVGSKEIFQKHIEYITLHIEWKDVPNTHLKTYYHPLISLTDNEDFKVKGEVLYDNVWKEVEDNKPIFDKNDATTAIDVEFIFPDTLSYYGEVISENLGEYTTDTRRGFFRVVLTHPPDAFGHGLYRDAYTKAIIEYANDPNDTDKKNAIPNEPYTPLVKDFWIDYKATTEINVKANSSYKTGKEKFIHIYPFGIKEERKASSNKVNLLPTLEFNNDTKDLESEGELYIGIKDLDPTENLSLLFQIAEGSADPELPKQEINWSYLSNNEWKIFEDTEVISDDTNSLIKSGIITFSIPSAADKDNTIMPSGLHWIKASVDKNSGAVCETLDIIAQAASATFKDNDNADDFLESVLPAQTIAKLVNKDASIKKVSQPYASLGGKPIENDQNFYTRVSERLRHKSRGITIWDYEKLILQEFPDIYKVKCINHSTYIPNTSEFAPGYVTVVVIPNLYNKNSVNSLEPRVSVGTLNNIKDFLKKKISLFAAEKLQVLNPLYEKIRVEFQVQLKKGYDWGYYKSKLQEDIKEFLSPWAYKEGSEISFGGKIHKSVILNFIEERDYVDFVAEFKMIQIITKEGKTESKYTDEAEPATSRSIFVSNSEHDINEVVNC